MIFPEYTHTPGFKSCATLSLVILPDGTVSDVKILFSDNKEVEDELLKSYELMPKWKPGKCKGKAVAVKIYKTLTSHT